MQWEGLTALHPTIQRIDILVGKTGQGLLVIGQYWDEGKICLGLHSDHSLDI